jgi:hypothetical protein
MEIAKLQIDVFYDLILPPSFFNKIVEISPAKRAKIAFYGINLINYTYNTLATVPSRKKYRFMLSF